MGWLVRVRPEGPVVGGVTALRRGPGVHQAPIPSSKVLVRPMTSSRHHTLALTFLSQHIARRASEKRPCAWLRIFNFRTALPAGPGFPRVGRGTEGSGTALPLRVAVGEGGRPHFSATVSARPDFPRAGRCLVRGPGASPASASCGLLLRDDGPTLGCRPI
jgi:hypothetical protein